MDQDQLFVRHEIEINTDRKKVWEVLMKIPYGTTTSYREQFRLSCLDHNEVLMGTFRRIPKLGVHPQEEGSHREDTTRILFRTRLGCMQLRIATC